MEGNIWLLFFANFDDAHFNIAFFFRLTIEVNSTVVESHWKKVHADANRIWLDPDALLWHPVILSPRGELTKSFKPVCMFVVYCVVGIVWDLNNHQAYPDYLVTMKEDKGCSSPLLHAVQ